MMPHFTRRQILFLGAGGLLGALAPDWLRAAGGSGSAADESAEKAHREIWRRFVAEDGTLFDYTDYAGKVILPTPEDCRDNKPNALGWWTPIENGSMFGGSYMDALCTRWRLKREPEIAAQARRLAGGLEKLGSVGKVPGFLARGFATDGVSHYGASSDDQSYPWFYGMWSYLTSGIPDDAERQRLSALVEKIALGFEENQWGFLCEAPGFGKFGSWDGAHCDANARLLFVIRATYEVTRNKKWLDLYNQKKIEKRGPDKLTRIELCAAGSHYVAPGENPNYPLHPPIWTSASSQAALRALSELDEDPAVRAQFAEGLKRNAANALPHFKLWKQYNEAEAGKLTFNIDWRSLSEPASGWKPQTTIKEAFQVGSNQWTPWKKLSPRRIYENNHMRDSFYAAWVIFLSKDTTLIDSIRAEFAEAMAHFDWSKLYTVTFFTAENAYWRAQE